MNYTFAPILCMQVKKVLSNGHYDLKEYTNDMLEEEQQSTLPDRKPYPIYPSKAGLEARLLGQSISRSVQAYVFFVSK
jgi:ATP-dependent DNA helicase RecG